MKIADDGKIYVCDRGNDRVQVFDKNSPELGKACSNPTGQPGKCGYVAERFVSDHTNIIGTAVSMNFSTDKRRAACMSETTPIWRSTFSIEAISRNSAGFGHSGRAPGDSTGHIR